MLNEIKQFMKQGVADQIRTAGEQVLITRPKEKCVQFYCDAVITSRDGTLSAVVGGAEYSVTGHALISESSLNGLMPKPGDNLTQSTGERWMITNAIISSNDAGVSCDLVRMA